VQVRLRRGRLGQPPLHIGRACPGDDIPPALGPSLLLDGPGDRLSVPGQPGQGRVHLAVAQRLASAEGTLLDAAALLLAAATSRHSYHRTRLTAAASPVLLALDAAAVAAAALAAPALTPALAVAAAFSLSRIAFTAWVLPRLTAR
jgi:hypothetical protein